MAETIHFTKSYFLKFRHLRKEICTCFSISICRLTRKYGFLVNSLRWPLKMVRYLLDPENHANQEVQIFVVTLRTLVKLPRPLRLCIYEKPPSIWKISLYQCFLLHHYNGGVGKCAKANQWRWMQGRWPKKTAEFLLHMLKNAESNAELRGFDVDSLVVEHIQVKKAPKMWHRTYRAHGWINPHMNSPCHMEMILTEKEHCS